MCIHTGRILLTIQYLLITDINKYITKLIIRMSYIYRRIRGIIAVEYMSPTLRCTPLCSIKPIMRYVPRTILNGMAALPNTCILARVFLCNANAILIWVSEAMEEHPIYRKSTHNCYQPGK